MQLDRRMPWSEALARENFAAALNDAVEQGRWPDPRYQLNGEVFDAVGAVADSFPKVDQGLVRAAERRFAIYLERFRAIYGED